MPRTRVCKIIGWQKTDGMFAARGYIIKQDDSGSKLTALLIESVRTAQPLSARQYS